MSLQTDIKAQMIEAMKAKEATKLSVLRSLMASFTNELIANKGRPDGMLSDDEVMTLITRAVKQRKDSIEQFEKGGRNDLADVEKAELSILQTYLPQQMTRAEIETYVKIKLNDPTTPEATRDDKNRMIGLVMKELKGRADGAVVKDVLDNILS